jgi:ribosomal protein S1
MYHFSWLVLNNVRMHLWVQAYRVGQKVKGRVIGARHLDGLSVLSLKPTVVEQQVASINEVKAGSLMTGTISSIADYGMLVSLDPGIR